jgi:hypothetical protein
MPDKTSVTPSTVNPMHCLESPDGSMQVQYRWSDDRFEHRILRDGQVCLSSVEGDAAQAWPPSPPIQQISLEPIQDAPTLLGVGGAGRGHWSISVGWQDADGGKDEGKFCFDIACRSKEIPEFLGSTYQAASDCGESLQIAVTTGTKSDRDGQTAILAEPDAAGQTYRWVYSIGR